MGEVHGLTLGPFALPVDQDDFRRKAVDDQGVGERGTDPPGADDRDSGGTCVLGASFVNPPVQPGRSGGLPPPIGLHPAPWWTSWKPKSAWQPGRATWFPASQQVPSCWTRLTTIPVGASSFAEPDEDLVQDDVIEDLHAGGFGELGRHAGGQGAAAIDKFGDAEPAQGTQCGVDGKTSGTP